MTSRPNVSNSPAEVTLEWLSKIRSSSVVPVRGSPIMKIGSTLSCPVKSFRKKALLKVCVICCMIFSSALTVCF